MITDLLKNVSYVCPACLEFHSKTVNLFTASDEEREVVCCELNESGVYLKNENELTLSVPCFACGLFHSFPVSLRRLNRGKAIIFNCPNSGMEIMALGNREEVARWEQDYERVLDRLLEAQEEYNSVINEIVNKVQMLCLEEKIKCDCPKCAPKLFVDDGAITINCKNCGVTLTLQTSTREDVQYILDLERLELRNPNEKKKSKLYLVRKD